MRRATDDHLYADRDYLRYLGPAGKTLWVTPTLRGLAAGAVLFVPLLVLLRALGFSGVILAAALIAGEYGGTKLIGALTGTERPFASLAVMFASEVSAPRPASDQAQTAVMPPAGLPAPRPARPRRGQS